MIDYNTTPEELKQQILDLAKKACAGDQAAGDEFIDISITLLRDNARQMGTKKGRENNLRRAIRLSVDDLKVKSLELSLENIIGNLWLINHGLNEFQAIIQDIQKGHTQADSFVYWVDQTGIERTSDFNDIQGYLSRMSL